MRDVSFSLSSWPTKAPFSITGHTFTEAFILTVILKQDGAIGRGEGTGVYYLGETGDTMLAQAETIRHDLAAGLTRDHLQKILPAGGARNAIDCALWDLEAKQSDQTIWELTGIKPSGVITVNTVGIGTPEEMAQTATLLDTPRIKVKLDGERPLDCIRAVRAARPDAEIVVDVNQGWTFEQLKALAPKFKALDIEMIEQPLARGGDADLEGYSSPVPLCADESCLDRSEVEQASRRYQMINIKLDKTGGLTEAMALAHKAKVMGLGLMVGNMLGTSLAMAPGFVIAQMCRYVDLDGAVLLSKDRENPMRYAGGVVSSPMRNLWG
ncbi:N-acetyl-D-Glu racemase DgcA [Paremcibacter congregatus]|uniref:Dipeptide epimerase n=1 Tax=Paremcibacter congregatus TaxID=2043170 RepID=A0A2G4YT21_9PROT|nr:N-acetyl-D-Glu racemase DgcA [Paremcibacter congregatus]PHZ85474.1 dipeptide epimerase [Paremcibacter congregatus]QDE28025.1 dipeptide epimerase [Paremcibacter congregatus]